MVLDIGLGYILLIVKIDKNVAQKCPSSCPFIVLAMVFMVATKWWGVMQAMVVFV